jgi:hypothetical protein
MTIQEWSIVIGVVVSGLLALGPWMFMVHAKLAAMDDTLDAICSRLRTAKIEYDPDGDWVPEDEKYDGP